MRIIETIKSYKVESIMSYEKMTIKEAIEKIGSNEIYLPAIQRKFVWKQEQIEKLFDSIQRGYPIGTFLFWFLKRPYIDDYVFYKFLQKYHQRDKTLNDKASKPELKDAIIGVLDGQQRLSAIYLALQGSYTVKKPHARTNDDSAFPEKELYLNLLSDIHEDEDNELNYSFQFITSEEKDIKTNKKLWFHVKDILTWSKDSPPIDDYYDSLSEENENNQDVLSSLRNKDVRTRIKQTLRDLHSRLVRDQLINYFKVEDQELDNILKIFVRVNSGGTVLSKTDLLFSTIIANWEDGREEIEKLISNINKEGDGFNFSNDFVMRCCLMLMDCPVLFKVGSFKTENVIAIKDNWKKIKESIYLTVQLLVEYGLNSNTLSSNNAVIPIAYYIMKGGELNLSTKKELKKFLFSSLLKNIFSGHGDTILSNFRNALRQDSENGYILKNKSFSFEEIALSSDKSLKITDDDINEFLDYKKGKSAFLVLSFLYPNLRYNQVKFHQDHIHPDSQFTDSKLEANGIPENKHRIFQELKDKLPNLQLMEGSENIKKRDTPFKDYLVSQDVDKFLKDNYIDKNENLEFLEFETFFNNRKARLENELKRLLK